MDSAPHASASVRVVHSSDLHLHDTRDGSSNVEVLRTVLAISSDLEAHATLLVGDIFDHGRVSDRLLEETADALASVHHPVIILPGNHDSLGPQSIYGRIDLQSAPFVHVVGADGGNSVVLRTHDLEIWGRPHIEYADFEPLSEHGTRRSRWRIVAAHGHWVSSESDRERAYKIFAAQLATVDADYVALGHWDRWVRLEAEGPPAYYSGSPDMARSVNLVELSSGGVDVRRVGIR